MLLSLRHSRNPRTPNTAPNATAMTVRATRMPNCLDQRGRLNRRVRCSAAADDSGVAGRDGASGAGGFGGAGFGGAAFDGVRSLAAFLMTGVFGAGLPGFDSPAMRRRRGGCGVLI